MAATQRKLNIHHLDAKTAFVDAKKKGLVCRLIKSIYGLKQAAKVWNEKLHGELIKMGFKQSTADLCLYSRKGSKGVQYVAIYVDDLLIADEDEEEI